MKKILTIFICFAVSGILFGSDPAYINFITGDVNVKLKGKTVKEANIGDKVDFGDTIMTGSDSLAELDQKDGSQIKISPNSVFMMNQYASGGSNYPSFACYLGGFSMKFNKLAGKPEPFIMTSTTIAGVRGTEFDVYAGADGSTLFVVRSGAVSVSAAGKTVDLGPDEGVELIAGKPLGNKFSTLGKPIDYKVWNQGRLDELLADPVTGLKKIEAIMDDYIAKLKAVEAERVTDLKKYEEAKTMLAKIKEEQGLEAGNEYYNSVVVPTGIVAGYTILNIRHYTLSAYSLKQHIQGRLYMKLKAGSMTGSFKDFAAFDKIVKSISQKFEDNFAVYLDKVDI